VVLHSEPAPLPRKGDAATEAEVELPADEPIPVAETPATIADAPAKSRRRRKAVA
jgi:hypothetical protein